MARILIVGHGRHGKDTLAGLINLHLNHRFRGSSQVAATEVIYPLMSNFYSTPDEAFNLRHDNRELWTALIRDFNRGDKARLAKIVCDGGFGYTGLREWEEVKECFRQGIFTHVIWIERPDIPENDPTMTFTFKDLLDEQSTYRNYHLMYVKNRGIEDLNHQVVGDIRAFLNLECSDSPAS